MKVGQFRKFTIIYFNKGKIDWFCPSLLYNCISNIMKNKPNKS